MQPGTQRTVTPASRSWATTPAATSTAGVPDHDTVAATGATPATSDRIVSGDASPEDVSTLESVAYQIDGRTICAFGEASSWPVEAIIAKFRDELLADTTPANAAKPHNPETEAQQRYLAGCGAP